MTRLSWFRDQKFSKRRILRRSGRGTPIAIPRAVIRIALALIPLLASCSLYLDEDSALDGELDRETFDLQYRLETARQFAARGDVGGIAWDHSCLWIATSTNVGGYYDNNEIHFECRNIEDGSVVKEHDFNHTYAIPEGIEVVGKTMWVNYRATGADRLEQFHTETGEILQTFALPSEGPSDLAYDGSLLLVGDIWNHYEALNLATGAAERSVDTVFGYSTMRGIAHRPGEVWLSSVAHNQLAVLDELGTQIAAADTTLLQPNWNYIDDLHLSFIGDQLAMSLRGQIHILDIIPIAPYELDMAGFRP